jgi:uncharacterized alpha-E superfamily protein
MMLSRVADSLYWMSRYLERAEHTARLIDVTLDLMPERSVESVGRAWTKLYASLQLDQAVQGLPDVNVALKTLTFDADHTSVVDCIASARENARQVREQISSEMWEQINRLYLHVTHADAVEEWQTQPHAFFQAVKQGAHLFQGVSDSTMNRGEGWHFIQLGQYIERASNTAVLLGVHLQDLHLDPHEGNTTDAFLDAVGLLRSCTAFEAYCNVYTPDPSFDSIAEFLLLNEEFPHSVNFSVTMMRRALGFIAEASDTRKNSQVNRRVGRLKAMLDYGHIAEIVSEGLHPYLKQVEQQCAGLHTALYQTYINYSVSDKLPV